MALVALEAHNLQWAVLAGGPFVIFVCRPEFTHLQFVFDTLWTSSIRVYVH